MRPSRLFYIIHQRHTRQASHHRSFIPRIGAWGLGLGLILMTLAIGGMLWLGTLYANLTNGLPSIQWLPTLLDSRSGSLLQPTELYDRTGQTLLYKLENPGIPRRYLLLDPQQKESLSPQLVQVVIAVFDPRFWQHSGFDWEKLTHPEPFTLAERLVSDLLLEKEPVGFRRALRMRLLAAQVTQQYGRARVLEWYLNSASFGHLAFGADSAAQLYLGKSASQLSLPEAALLVAAMRAPALNPIDATQACLENQQGVLELLMQQGLIQSEERAQAQQFAFTPQLSATTPQPIARAFSNLVLDHLAQRLGRNRIERGGLRVITTLDLELQEQVVCTLHAQIIRLQGGSAGDVNTCEAARLLPTLPPNIRSLPTGLKGSAVLLDPTNGQILAYVGDSSASSEAGAITSHEPGSLLTPFLAVSSFASGFSPSTLIWDIPDSFQLVSGSAPIQIPEPQYHGPMRFRTALANDHLAPLNRILNQIGAENVWRLAKPLGLTNLAQSPASGNLLYEGGGSTLLQVAQAYGVFAAQGILNGESHQAGENSISSVTITSVQDQDGRTLYDNQLTQNRAVLSQPLSYLVHHILSDETARWQSLGHPNSLEIGRPVGAKTGVSKNGAQTWTAGYTPYRVAVVWMGIPSETQPPLSLDVRGAAGIWHAVMQYASRDLPAAGWNPPQGVTNILVCDPSGQLPTKSCPSLVNEVFLQGNEPSSVDPLYQVFQVNRETNRLATVFTPLELVEERTYLVLPNDALAWGRSAGLPVPPANYDLIQPPQPSATFNISQPAIFSAVRGKVTIRGSATGVGFASYRVQAGVGLNPATWGQIGLESMTPVQDGILAIWETPATSGLYAVRLQVIRQDHRVDTAVIQVTVDNTPPIVRILAPLAETKLTAGRSATALQAEARDEIGIQRVEFWMDGLLVGELRAAPYTLAWQPLPGSHSFVVKAYDLAGNLSETAPVIFFVN